MPNLTAEDLKALKTADKVVFRHIKGVTTLEAYLDGGFSEQPRILTASQQRLFPKTYDSGLSERVREIIVAGYLTWYESSLSQHHGDTSSQGFDMIHSAQYHDVWRTLVGLLKVGDILILGFEGDAHSNGNTKNAGMHADALRLVVKRPSNRGEQKMTFEVTSQVGPANSARMVKPHGY